MMWLLKLPFDQNSIMINHKFNGDFIATSFLDGLKIDTRGTCSITRPIGKVQAHVFNGIQIPSNFLRNSMVSNF